MADTKITALTAITTVDPAVDVFPIVDVSDTTMAASGTTKKITSNQLLGAGGTATLASATITGDLTVDTNVLKVNTTTNRVGINTTTPSQNLEITGSGNPLVVDGCSAVRLNNTVSGRPAIVGVDDSQNFIIWNVGTEVSETIKFLTGGGNGKEQYRITHGGVFNWYDGAGSTRMTLNATGLGVGVTPAAGDGSGAFKAAGTGSLTANSRVGLDVRELVSGNQAGIILGAMTTENTAVIGSRTASGNIAFQTYNGASWGERMRIDYLGNVGIGVTPSAWGLGSSGYRAFEIGAIGNSIFSATNDLNISSNAYYLAGWKYGASSYASQYSQGSGKHIWYTASSGTAGNAITFTQAMTLDASGNLFVSKTATGLGTVGIQASPSGWIQATVSGDASLFTNRLASDGKTIQLYRQTLEVGNISVTTTGATFNSTSDYRLKEAVAPLSGGLARVNALKPSIYKWKSNGSSGEGFLAHELAEVVPAAVSGEKDAVNEDGSIKAQSIDMSRVVPILVAAIQELTARVQTLETR